MMKRAFSFPWRTRRRIEADAAEELRFHLDARTEELVARGMDPAAARAQAVREFGDVESTRRYITETDVTTESTRRRRDYVSEFIQDVTYAIRKLRASPTFAITAILTLAFGIGANTSVFNLVNAVLFKPPAVREPATLQWIAPRDRRGHYGAWSLTDFETLRGAGKAWSGIAAFSGIDASLTDGVPVHVTGQVVSASYFDVIGVLPRPGRGFIAREDSVAAGGVPVVLGYALWKSRFDGDSAIVGRTISINAQPMTVVGIAPEGFNGLRVGDEVGIWFPLSSLDALFGPRKKEYTDPGSRWLMVVGRLARGTSASAADAEAAMLSTRFDPDIKDSTQRRVAGVLAVKGGLDPQTRPKVVGILSLLSLVPLLVLGIACANVANLFLARGVQREREIAVRRALGATRGRLVRQLLTECVVLGLIAGGVGMVASSLITQVVAQLGELPPDVLTLARPDATVFAATLLLAIGAGALFGLAPSLAATGASITPSLKSDGIARAAGGGRHRLRNAFVVSQVSLSLALLIAAGLFVGSVKKALGADPGYDPRDAVSAEIDLAAQGYDTSRAAVFTRTVLDRLRGEPGVRAATVAAVLPLSGSTWATNVRPDGADTTARGFTPYYSFAGDGFFDAMGIPIVKGRAFDVTDTRASVRVAVVNARLAEELWPGEDPLGRRFKAGLDSVAMTVVGVAKNGKYRTLLEEPAVAYFWAPASQRQQMVREVLMVRSGLGTDAAAATLRRVVTSVDPGVPLFRLNTLEHGITASVDAQRAGAAMLAVAGVLALALAGLGIFGVIAHGVTSRTREIGIRMSLGARAGDVVSQFVREGLRLTLIGGAVGLALGLGFSKIVASFLFGLTPADALTFAGAVTVLTIVAFIASLIPARRAAHVSPMVALRSE